MHLVTLGINHTAAPVAVREQFTFEGPALRDALQSLMQSDAILEAAIICTCNRTEIYCYVDESYDNGIPLWLQLTHPDTYRLIRPYTYHYLGQDVVKHLYRVACGLDSMVLGEPQILGQLKSAYAQALNAKTLGKSLGRLFQHAFAVAKQVRTDTAIGSSPVSVAFAAVSLSKQIFSHLNQTTALLIGAGETIELVARHLFDNGIKRIIIANRTLEKAHALATLVNGYAISLREMPAHLPEADIVITSTASPLPILGKGMIESALKQRKRRPIFMVDIAVPRDIEPEVGQLEDIYLFCVDDLKEIIEENLQSRRDAAKQAEEIIDAQVGHFAGWMRSQHVVPAIRAIRAKAEQHRAITVEKALRQIKAGAEPERVIHELAHRLTNRLMHEPSRQLRQSAYESAEEDPLLHTTRRLFNVKD